MSQSAADAVTAAWAPIMMNGAALAAPSILPLGAPKDAYSPGWWLRTLFARLTLRQPAIDLFERYYSGDHPLPWLTTEAARDEFRRIMRMTRSNYMGLVVDAQVERMVVEGFRIGGSEEADRESWLIWQANDMDADSDQGFLEAAKSGTSYLMVGPNPDEPALPRMSVEHPSQVIIGYAPGSTRRRLAGLKVFRDEWTGGLQAGVYLPEDVYRFTATAGPYSAAGPRWTPSGDPEPNPLGEVPFVELPNNPRMLKGGVSELADLLDPQDRINKTLADRLMTQDFGAWPLMWAVAFPEEDVDGNKQTIEVGRNRMIRTDVEQTKFGQFTSAPLDPYSAAKREDVKDIASRSRTPAQYLLGEMSNVNGETLKASESGLVAKVRQRCRGHEHGLEEACRMARNLAGLPTARSVTIETIWRDPEFRTEGERVDALVKMRAMGLPLRAVFEKWGASQVEIGRWMSMVEAEPVAAPAVTPGLVIP